MLSSSNPTTTKTPIKTLILSLMLVTPLAFAQTGGGKGSLKKSAKPAPTAEDDTSSMVKASGAEPELQQGESMKFNTDVAPTNNDRHAPMQFKDPGEAPLGTPRPEYADSLPEETPFKTYIGYPKHQIGAYVKQMSLSSNWTYGSNTYNFTSPSTGLGLNYRLMVTPLWNIEVDYIHYSMNLDESKIGSQFKILSSTATFDDYSVKGSYCFIGKATFYRQICPGILIGNDGYPVLNFESGSLLSLTKVKDVVIGASIAYQEPFTESLLFKIIAGYNYGTGIGNSGYLTSKKNSSYFVDPGLEWTITEHNLLLGYFEYKARSANISGRIGNTDAKWDTTSSLLGFKLGYSRSF